MQDAVIRTIMAIGAYKPVDALGTTKHLQVASKSPSLVGGHVIAGILGRHSTTVNLGF